MSEVRSGRDHLVGCLGIDCLPDEAPLISCLMVTRNRLEFAKRAMRCFADQTYTRLELVVVPDGDRAYLLALQRHVERHRIENVRFAPPPQGMSLGMLRNFSLDTADGDIVCQWDDDDCHHPDRVTRQATQLLRQGTRACFLTDNLHFLEPSGTLFWTNWARHGPASNEYHVFLPTVMMYRDDRFRYPIVGPEAHTGEDLVIAGHLWREVPVSTLGGLGHLYLYQYHGGNTCSSDHHSRITGHRSFASEAVRGNAEEIRRAVEQYGLPRPVVVCGSDGPAFRID